MMNEDQEKPQDLSMKARREKKIPPPLDLNAHTLDQDNLGPNIAHDIRLQKSPSDLPRECLPIRKRPLVEVRRDLHDCKSPKSAGPNGAMSHAFSNLDFRFPNSNTAPSSPLNSAPPRLPMTSTMTLTPSSASSLASSFTHFPVPPPLLPMPKSPFLPQEFHYPWLAMHAHAVAAGLPFSPVLTPHSPMTFPSSTALLSPAPSSYPSSTNSSREDLPANESKRRYFATPTTTSNCSVLADSSCPSSPLPPSSPLSHPWPMPVWQCFQPGVMVKFVIPTLDTPWQKADDLGWKDRVAMKIDSKQNYQYAPNGLVIIKIDVISVDSSSSSESCPSPFSLDRPSAFTALRSQQNSSSTSAENKHNEVSTSSAKTVLRLRMAPFRGDKTTEILADCPIDHPFFVKDKGWCSASPRLTLDRLGLPCHHLSPHDVCLPPNHPEAVRTPDLCDKFRRFDFDSPDVSSPVISRLNNRKGGLMSPPMSPARKKETNKEPKDENKPKRPMNGFMLFAKKFRLELIQQHPGKDNRAISVLLGESWKSLPPEEREQFSHRAKVMADEQKKLHPDCWKRKRTVSQQQQQQQTVSSPSLLSNLPPPLFSS